MDQKEWIFVSEIAVNLPEPGGAAIVALGVGAMIRNHRRERASAGRAQ